MGLHEAEQRLVEVLKSYLDAIQKVIGRPTEADWAAADQATEELRAAG